MSNPNPPATPLSDLFAPPPPNSSPNRDVKTPDRSNVPIDTTGATDVEAPAAPPDNNHSELKSPGSSSLSDLFAPPDTPVASGRTARNEEIIVPSLPSLQPVGEKEPLLGSTKPPENEPLYTYMENLNDQEMPGSPTMAFRSAKQARIDSAHSSQQQDDSVLKRFLQTHFQPTTFAGALMFLMYHVVFCLANASAITIPNRNIVGAMAKVTALGMLFAGPVYIYRLGPDIPALYPSTDLFLSPFLAQAALQVDASLQEHYGPDYADALFLGTFAVLSAIGMFMAGTLLLLAGTFKLASLGTYLPYSVLCGFFSAVGVLLWALSFSVDTSGLTWQHVFFSGDKVLIYNSLLHHIPSLVVGILMNRLGPKNPFFVILLIVVTLASFYSVMWVTGTSMEEAQEAQWFWSREQLAFHPEESATASTFFLPPAPFGSFGALFAGHVCWPAVRSGMGHMASLAILYLLRSSIHAAAMKKNVGNLVRRVPIVQQEEEPEDNAATTRARTAYNMASNMAESVRQGVHTVNMSMAEKKRKKTCQDTISYKEIRAQPSKMTLEEIFTEYGYALYVVAFFGGFGNCPTVATSNTMFAIGAEDAAPQYGSVLLLLFFYFTDFQFVRFIPKAAFSSLLVLGAVDTLVVWFIYPFKKTQEITEWLVVPFIVLFSLIVGFLNAVFLGIAISMFVFVASFFRIGVVKYNASGLEIRSRVERPMAQSMWLDDNGDLIQVIVLQNYLFFGNASGIRNYIETMFEEVDEMESRRLDFSLPPRPKVVVVDMSLITGMDTSTMDIFGEIKDLCTENDAKLFLCGLSDRMKRGLALGGVKQETGPRSKRGVRFFSDLDKALGSAEDDLLETEMTENFKSSSVPGPRTSGFRYALDQIDEVHGQKFAHELTGLEKFCTRLDLEPGQSLFFCDGGPIQESDRGLFFVESGLLKIERNSSHTLTMTRSMGAHQAASSYTLKYQHARMGTLARNAAIAKINQQGLNPGNLRVARFGPGWVVGALENSGLRPSGCVTAVAQCRLHHLPFHKLEEIETQNPALVLKLYKMLSHIIACREQTTVEHLHTLHNIISSPAHSKPLSRAALRSLAGAS